jgi:hypothetical protein
MIKQCSIHKRGAEGGVCLENEIKGLNSNVCEHEGAACLHSLLHARNNNGGTHLRFVKIDFFGNHRPESQVTDIVSYSNLLI